jgi:hypothetical protein
MRHFPAVLRRLSIRGLKRSVLASGLAFCAVCSVSANDMTVSEDTFDCILDWAQVRKRA